MIRSRLGLKVLGPCVLALGLLAIGAGGAQAEPGAFWLVNGAKMPEELLPFLGGEIEPLKADGKVHLVLLTTRSWSKTYSYYTLQVAVLKKKR